MPAVIVLEIKNINNAKAYQILAPAEQQIISYGFYAISNSPKIYYTHSNIQPNTVTQLISNIKRIPGINQFIKRIYFSPKLHMV